jgi:hypothetical protein
MQFDPRFGGLSAACINRPYITSINLGELVPFFLFTALAFAHETPFTTEPSGERKII